MSALSDLLETLRIEVLELREEYLKRHLGNPESGPQEWGNSVKSFCVLCHAAFEDFAEELSLGVASHALEKWNQPKREVGQILLCLTSFYGAKLTIEVDESKTQDRANDQLRKEIDEIARKHRAAIDENNGFSKKYLRKILTPVGINLPENAVFDAALNKISSARGSFAHTTAKGGVFTTGRSKWGKDKKVMSPDDAFDVSEDCLSLCKELVSLAKKLTA